MLAGFENMLFKLTKKHKSTVDELRKRGAKIGTNVWIGGDFDYGHGFLIEIGDNVTLSHVSLLTHNASTKIPLGYSKIGKITIGCNVFIGYNSIVLPNVKIGDNVIVGAGSVVTHDIPSNTVVAGNQARVVGTYDAFVEKNRDALKTHPVYSTYWKEKTDSEKELIKRELADTFGYDI